MQSFYDRFGLRKVINARGPATVLGASRVKDGIRQDIYDMLGLSVEMWELQRRANEAIVKLTGAEAGVAAGCTAAGMAISIAATLTGDDMGKIKELPIIRGPKHKVVIQKGHVIGIGDTPANQLIRLTGAEPVEIGEALDCASYHLEAALTSDVAAAVYVMMDVFPPNLLPFDKFVEICKSKGVPVIVDAAYDTDFRHSIAKGADLVVHSGQKWLGGATSALVAGRKDLVHACFLQELGIGRPMKVGKEGVLGLISAIEHWLARDEEAIIRQQEAFAERFIAAMAEVPGLTGSIKRTRFSPSVRVVMEIDEEQTGVPAWEINMKLGTGDPVIKMDDYAVYHGKMEFDLSFLDDGDERTIIKAIASIVEEKKKNGGAVRQPEPMNRLDLQYHTLRRWLDDNPRA
ncbi:PLP-dependent transferase [Paenibacillus sp. 32O-W]|uniref:aminotransferase class V-fold PLP-dependent enzyme n=1 Tax=Paenibacillus sp. 32O-W TaxID=1695218 RepID=UPI0011A4B5D2|nr:PLP-dependent transferase [Paenibacillus sp. 32O-W]